MSTEDYVFIMLYGFILFFGLNWQLIHHLVYRTHMHAKLKDHIQYLQVVVFLSICFHQVVLQVKNSSLAGHPILVHHHQDIR